MNCGMDLIEHIKYFDIMDGVAITFAVICWLGIGYFIENSPKDKPSVSHLMVQYRRDWMINFLTRNPRIFDATIMAIMRDGTTFFASTCMLAIGGGFALIGNQDPLLNLAKDLSLESAPAFVWEVKILVGVLFLTAAFLKFVWAHRLFGYCAVVMAAAPNDNGDHAIKRANQAAEINITAARAFNRGLRSVYFTLAILTWFVGPISMIIATCITVWIIWRREFASVSRKILLDGGTL